MANLRLNQLSEGVGIFTKAFGLDSGTLETRNVIMQVAGRRLDVVIVQGPADAGHPGGVLEELALWSTEKKR